MIMIWLLLLCCLALGLVLCFKGRTFTFLALGVLAALYCRYAWPEYFPEGIWGIVLLVFIGMLAAGMIHTLYRLGMFAVGAVLGAAAGMMLLGAVPSLEAYRWVVLGVCGIAVGIFAVFCSDWFVIVATSFGGAVFSVLAVTFAVAERTNLDAFLGSSLMETAQNVISVLNRSYIEDKGIAPAIGLIVLGVAGCLVQKKDME